MKDDRSEPCDSHAVRGIRQELREMPIVARHAAIGALAMGAVGSLVGLTIGLLAYWPTAWAATFEVGLPAAVLGAVLGTLSGAIVFATRPRHPHQH